MLDTLWVGLFQASRPLLPVEKHREVLVLGFDDLSFSTETAILLLASISNRPFSKNDGSRFA